MIARWLAHRMPTTRAIRVVLLGGSQLLILGLGLVLPERAASETGLLAIRDPLLSLGLLYVVASAASGLGLRLLSGFVDSGPMEMTRWALAAGIGMGVIAYSLLTLGLLGQLGTAQLLFVLILAVLVSLGSVGELYSWMGDCIRSASGRWRACQPPEKLLLVAGLIMALGALLRALAPPTGYDGLMYHIYGAKLFLEEGRIFPSSTIWMMNMPFTTEMLFMIGPMFGTESIANLLHAGFCLVFLMASVGLSRRVLGPTHAYLSLAALLSMPILGIAAPMANVDFSWASFEVLAIYSAVVWKGSRNPRWLLLSGAFAGLGLGSKYLALPGTAALALFIAWNCRGGGLRSLLKQLVPFTVVTIAVASPWYAKNWLWHGDPLFPFLGGGQRLDSGRMSVFLAHIKTYGGVRSVTDWLTIPFRLYFDPSQFSEIAPHLSQPSVLFLLLIAYPLTKRNATTTELIALTAVRVCLLSAGALVTRHLFPSFAVLSIATAEVLRSPFGSRRLAPAATRLLEWTVSFSVLISLILQVAVAFKDSPLKVVVGMESQDGYLRRTVPTYAAWTYARQHLPPDSQVLSTGDGRLLVCRTACVETDDQFLWARLVDTSDSPEEFQRMLSARGVSHLLVSLLDIEFFRSHDAAGLVARAESRLNSYLQACGTELYSDEYAAIYRLTCGQSRSQAPIVITSWSERRERH